MVTQPSIRLWVDDVRRPPDKSWVWARTNGHAKDVLYNERVGECSLDHDMGLHELDVPENTDDYWDSVIALAHASRDQHEESGLDLVNWMIENRCVPALVTIHSWNPEGASNMAARLNQNGYDCVLQAFRP